MAELSQDLLACLDPLLGRLRGEHPTVAPELEALACGARDGP